MQIGEQPEDGHREGDVGARDAFGGEIACGDRREFAVEPVDIVIARLQTVIRCGREFRDTRAPERVRRQPLRRFAAGAVKGLERLTVGREIRMPQRRQARTRDQGADLIARARVGCLRQGCAGGDKERDGDPTEK